MLAPKSICVDPEQWQQLKEVCDKNCIDRSKLIRKWIRNYLIKNNVRVK